LRICMKNYVLIFFFTWDSGVHTTECGHQKEQKTQFKPALGSRGRWWSGGEGAYRGIEF
jgi:hypothetical protein